jgi:hypothetical protein
MNTICTIQPATRLGLSLLLLAAAVSAPAQTANRSVRPAAQPPAPAVAPGGPNPAGLPSPLPNPAGLSSGFPAGLPSPLPSPAGLTSATVPNLASPGTPAGNPPVDAGAGRPQTSTMGGGAAGGVAPAPQSGRTGTSSYTALQLAQSFLGADANRDGELTRGEAQRLTVMPYSFEEMDRNHDGILTRFEYEDGVR